MGTRLAPDRWRRASLISTGPVAQLRPDHVDLHGVEHGQGRADFGAGQHAARELNRHLRLQRHDPTERHHGPAGAVDGGLDREQVELGLDEQQVDAALEQPERLLLVRVAELGVGDLTEGGELGARSHGPGHPARPLGRGELVAHGTGQLGPRPGQLAGALGHPVLDQHDRGRPERVGLDHVAAHLVERAVHLGHEIGPRVDQDFVAAFELGPAEVLCFEARAAGGWSPWRRRRPPRGARRAWR